MVNPYTAHTKQTLTDHTLDQMKKTKRAEPSELVRGLVQVGGIILGLTLLIPVVWVLVSVVPH